VSLAARVDRHASVAAFGAWERPMLKHRADLDRYRHLIAVTRPQVIIETGTRTGDSARWFAAQPGVELVVSVDVTHRRLNPAPGVARIEWVRGSSVRPSIIQRAATLVAGRRSMVSLDSDHSAAHVAAEIRGYGPLVTSGCHLVVEDGITGWLDTQTRREHVGKQQGDPLDAIRAVLADDPRFERDTDIEAMFAVSMHPAGWWRRR
jgi:cephalosporin hydroxylase